MSCSGLKAGADLRESVLSRDGRAEADVGNDVGGIVPE